ncbi:hypothetical protein [Acetobacter okinawensis]|uniref:hypothetical protein n=1 Tax=Acetobacter okinawensis TaxID=1076594 RepID=UPI0020A122AB|nr:hypothetical protein [Acetobacter okinawensis]MCP1213784.1 hypothetical protein [Acetobacter okinawensis]
MTETVPTLETSVRRLGRERQQEKTVEAVIDLAPTYATVAAFVREAGLSAPRRAATIQKESRLAFQDVIDDYDLTDPTDVEELEIWLRLDLQEIVEAALDIIIASRDEVFQIEQIMAQTTIEQRLQDKTFRERRQVAGHLLNRAWFAGQWVVGAWGACKRVMDKWQKTAIKNHRNAVYSPHPVKRDLSEQKVVMLSAWKKAISSGRSE